MAKRVRLVALAPSPGGDMRDGRPFISGFRGVLLYIVAGIALTFFSYAILGEGAATLVGPAFLLGALVAFPWIAVRGKDQ